MSVPRSRPVRRDLSGRLRDTCTAGLSRGSSDPPVQTASGGGRERALLAVYMSTPTVQQIAELHAILKTKLAEEHVLSSVGIPPQMENRLMDGAPREGVDLLSGPPFGRFSHFLGLQTKQRVELPIREVRAVGGRPEALADEFAIVPSGARHGGDGNRHFPTPAPPRSTARCGRRRPSGRPR